jgi:hypothetical protein
VRLRWIISPSLAAIVACGSRSALLVPLEEQAGAPDAGGGRGSYDFKDDGGAGSVANPQASPEDAASQKPDGLPFVYLISEQDELLTFYPPSMTFTTIGTITCPVLHSFVPWSMAIDRSGTAYVLFASTTSYPSASRLFLVNTGSASCQSTAFAGAPSWFDPMFTLAYVKNDVGDGETLYAAAGNGNPFFTAACMADPGTRLATIDTTTFAISLVGTVRPSRCSPNLTGTSAGGLFGFYATTGTESAIGQIDKRTAQLTHESLFEGIPLWGPGGGGAWALAFWGGDFYIFTLPYATSRSVVTRFRPSDGSLVKVGNAPQVIVAASASTRAP